MKISRRIETRPRQRFFAAFAADFFPAGLAGFAGCEALLAFGLAAGAGCPLGGADFAAGALLFAPAGALAAGFGEGLIEALIGGFAGALAGSFGGASAFVRTGAGTGFFTGTPGLGLTGAAFSGLGGALLAGFSALAGGGRA